MNDISEDNTQNEEDEMERLKNLLRQYHISLILDSSISCPCLTDRQTRVILLNESKLQNGKRKQVLAILLSLVISGYFD